MKLLVYTAEPRENNATLESFEEGDDKMISRLVNLIESMDLQRVMDNQTVNLLTRNVEYNKSTGIVTADAYKQTNRGKALHQLAEKDDEMTIEEILAEHEEAFVQGTLGLKKVNNEPILLLEKNFGSFFVNSCKGIKLTFKFSSDSIKAIQDSETIGRTTLDFADDYDLEASLINPPEDQDIREEKGLGNMNIGNKFASLLNISNAHRISVNINKDVWLKNVDLFRDMIESDIVKTVRIENTTDGVVRLGEGGDRAIRKTINTSASDRGAIIQAFGKMADDT